MPHGSIYLLMQQIREYFQQFTPMSDADWQIFSTRLEVQEFPKKTLLLQPGKVEKYLSFIETGIVRQFIPHREYDQTFAFAFGGQFISAYDSFLTQSQAVYATETLAATILWRISYADLQDIYTHSTAGNLIGRKASEDLFIKKSARELALLTQTAEERYLHLLEGQPHLIRDIPLKYIASYIGITPQALSRIRRRIA